MLIILFLGDLSLFLCSGMRFWKVSLLTCPSLGSQATGWKFYNDQDYNGGNDVV